MSDNHGNDSRRNFLRNTGLALFAGVAASKFASVAHAQKEKAAKPAAPAKPAAGKAEIPKGLNMVKPTEPQAQALGYYEDVAKIDKAKWPKYASNQFCYNCQFYQAKGDHKNTVAAPCTIFQGKGVMAKGWCNSWVQNPAVKA